jgi:riboflavin transporter FmnP
LNSKSLALTATFSSLAIILNAIRIPTFYWPNMIYLLADIPVIIAFLLYGFKTGILVEILHILGQLIFFPVGTAGFVAYPTGLLINLLMFSGIYLANKFIVSETGFKNHNTEKKKAIIFTGFAAIIRTGIMPIYDFFIFYHLLLPLALGVSIPEIYIIGLVPSFVLYHFTTTLYTIPTAYLIARKVSNYLKIKPTYLP